MRHPDLLTPAVIGIGLSMDSFAVSPAIGTQQNLEITGGLILIAIGVDILASHRFM
jgi:putative Mn2+ efflux pump MntP